jgi:alkylation response protein AidB-like acyl-CoA dehydrogenase
VDFNLSEEQEMLRDSARRFVREHYGFEARRALASSTEGISRQHWRSYADLGWLAIALPEEAGGLGFTFVETALVLEEFGRGLVLEPYVSTAVVAARLIERARDFALRGDTLAALIAGERMLAVAHAEPGSRYDLDRAASRAHRRADAFVIDGHKGVVIDGPCADQFLLTATVAGDEAYSLFVVDKDTPGLVADSYQLIDGSRACDLRLSAVSVSASRLLAGPAAARELVEEALDRGTVARIAEAVGAMEAVMQITSDYLKTRIQFGQPLGKFQASQHRMAEMFVETQESRSSLFRAIAHLDGDSRARRAAVSAAKVAVSAAAKFVGAQGIQLHGGIGLTEEYSIGHYFKKLTAFEKIWGDAEWHLSRFVANHC